MFQIPKYMMFLLHSPTASTDLCDMLYVRVCACECSRGTV